MDWEDEFKKFILKMFHEIDPDINIGEIQIVSVKMSDVDIKNLDVKNLGKLYAFSIMQEDYELAGRVKEELASRGCNISIDIDEQKKEGKLNINYSPPSTLENIVVNLKVLKDGLSIDWDKEGI